jgi:gamma-glutamyl:cysteine ligase YbdK (ATP-grasp superfamily)
MTPTAVFAVQRRFDHAPALTVGVEEEVILLDPVTFLPSDAVEDVLAWLDRDPRFKPELRCAQLELVTPPASTVADVARELAAARRILAERLRGRIRFAALGTHPSSTTISAVTPTRRFREIGEETARSPSTTRSARTCRRSPRWPRTRRSTKDATPGWRRRG